MARTSKAVTDRIARILDVMLRHAEHAPENPRYRTTAEWYTSVNAQCREDESLERVTDPQLRRCLAVLEDEGKIQGYGQGRKKWRAVTLAMKLKARQSATAEDAWRKLVAKIADSPLQAGYTGYTPHALYDELATTRPEYGEHQLAIVISPRTAEALVEMLNDFPGIAAQYFDFDFGEVSRD